MPRTKASTIARPRVPPAAERTLLDRVIAIAPAPLLPGENPADYNDIAARIVNASQPRDVIEELLVRDVIDLTWEILRIRRAKAGILRASTNETLSKVLTGERPFWSRGDPDPNAELIERWASGDVTAAKKVTALLVKTGMTFSEVTAKTLERKLGVFERLDRVLASTETRRNNALREIDRHREALGTSTRQSIDDIQDAEFQDLETGETTAGAKP